MAVFKTHIKATFNGKAVIPIFTGKYVFTSVDRSTKKETIIPITRWMRYIRARLET